MKKQNKKNIKTLLSMAKKDRHILAVILFGSYARNENKKGSDIDVCLVLNKKTNSLEKRMRCFL